jgi:hypothetical protein
MTCPECLKPCKRLVTYDDEEYRVYYKACSTCVDRLVRKIKKVMKDL